MKSPRSGLLGAWDRLVGPGMTRGETTLVLAACGLGSAIAAIRISMTGRSAALVLLAAAIGFDVIGGAVCNATDTTKAWYHRRGQGWLSHIAFVLPHLLYVALIAALLRGRSFDLQYTAWLGGCIVVSAAAVLSAPLRLKRPVAFAAYLAAVSISIVDAGPTLGLEWFTPALFLKLLIGHLVPDRTMSQLHNSFLANLTRGQV